MTVSSHIKKPFAIWALACALLAVIPAVALAQQATVTTDQDDYAPGDTALITGAGFASAVTVTLQVVHLTGAIASGSGHEPWTITADDQGAFSDFWLVDPDDSPGSTFLLTADSPDGRHAEATFSDTPLGTGRVTSVVPTDGGCVHQDSLPTNAVESWDVQQGKTYQITLSDVECSGTTIQVIVKSSDNGNQCLTAGLVSAGVYSFKVTLPVTACNTYPILYCTSGCGPETGSFARRSDGGDKESHLRAATFAASCTSPVADTDCASPPVGGSCSISCPQDVKACTDQGVCEASSVDLGTPSISGSCTGVIVSNDAPSTFPKGTTTVTWTATLPGGGQSSCNQKVTVEDCEDPTISCPLDITVNHDAGQCCAKVEFKVTASDNCPGVQVDSDPSSGTCFKVGTTTVTSTATDASGRTASCHFDVTVLGSISGVKFYDANADGLKGGESGITGWKIELLDAAGTTVLDTKYTDNLGAYSFNVPPGTYTVREVLPNGSWLATTLTSNQVTVTSDDCDKGQDFGNLCLGAGGGHTLGFWSNKNGQTVMNDGGTMVPELSLLCGLNLVNANGTPFNPSNYNDFRAWLLNATAVNMAYMLSAQLAAMELNVEAGFVSGGSLVYAPGCGNTGAGKDFISISDLMSCANASLCAHPSTLSGNTYRAGQECLKNALDSANNNLNFVQARACPFTSPY